MTVDRHDGVLQEPGNFKIIQALGNIAPQPPGPGHQFKDTLNRGPLKNHSARHNKADIPRAQDDDALSGHKPLHIDKTLRRSRRINTCGARSRDGKGSCRALTAPHA